MEPIKIKLCQDLDRGLYFSSVIDLKYLPGSSAVDFYNKYREAVLASLMQQINDSGIWQQVTAEEQLSPTFEDLILANVLRRIHVGLPSLVR
jgi:hypothetical protein